MKKIKKKSMIKISALFVSVLLMMSFVLPVYADDIDTLPDEAVEYLPDDYADPDAYIKDGLIAADESSQTGLPSWYPDDVSTFQDFHNENAPRIVDNADIFTESEEADLTARIQNSIAETNIDFVIYTDTTNYGLGNQLCAADFYQFNGYGIGDDYNGSVLFINMDPAHREYYTAARGDCRKYYTQDTVNALQDVAYDDMKSGDYASAMRKYIDAMTGLYKTGKVPEATGDFILRLIVCIIIGLIAGAITIGVLTSQMKKVKIADRAREYLVRDSVNMRTANDYFLYAHVTRTRIPKNNGKGGSSFSGGFSSSGGGSFSGGGRSF